MNSNYEQLQHFISVSPWDSFAVEGEVAQKVYGSLSSSSDDKNIGLLLDESGWEKSGKKSVGVARQYIGQRGKIANGQVGVFAALNNGTEVGLVQGRLYLPESWTKDAIRCKKAGIPESEQVYRTKPELSIEIIKSLPKTINYAWVGGDCLYGNSPTLRQYLYGIERDFVLDVGQELQVYLELPKLYVPAKNGKKGRNPSRYVCDAKPINLKKLVSQISKKQWKTIVHRHGTKGAMVRKAVMLDVYIWKPEKGTNIEAVQLLISMETDKSEIKYSLCYSSKQKMSLKTALWRQMQRYWIERAFQDVKQQLGMHQYQVRSWKAWNHHIALSLMALHFLLEIKIENKEQIPLISIPDIKLIFAVRLSNKLHTQKGLLQTINNRHKRRKRDLDRYSKVPK